MIRRINRVDSRNCSSRKRARCRCYEEISDKEALDKIKQTLRFQIERHEGLHSPRSRDLINQMSMTLSSRSAVESASMPFTAHSNPMWVSLEDQLPALAGVTGRNPYTCSMLQGIDDHLAQRLSNDDAFHLLQGTNTHQGGTKPSATGIQNIGEASYSPYSNSRRPNLNIRTLHSFLSYSVCSNSNTSLSTLLYELNLK